MQNKILQYTDYYSCHLNQNYLEKILQTQSTILFMYNSSFKSILYRKLNARQINHHNRRLLYIKLITQLNPTIYFHEEIFQFKFIQIYGSIDHHFISKDYLIEHHCFQNQNYGCCIIKYNQEFQTKYICTNPSCFYSNPKFNFFSCCLFQFLSSRTLEIVRSSDPNLTHLSMVSTVCHFFTFIFDHDYQVYQYLLVLISSNKIYSFDKTTTKARVSTVILRCFLKNLCRYMFHSHNVRHPWLRILYNIDPFHLVSNFNDSPWIFYDWQTILIHNTKTVDLFTLMDAFLLRGIKEFYKYILFHFAILFKRMNSKKNRIKYVIPYHNSHMISALKKTIQDDLECSIKLKFFYIVEKLKVTNTNIAKYYDKIYPIIHSTHSSQINLSDNSPKFLYELILPSDTLDSSEWRTLLSWLPENIQLLTPQLVYSSNQHGWSLKNLYSKSEDYSPTLIIIKTSCKSIFGSYLTHPLSLRKSQQSSFGDGQIFVFSIKPQLCKYSWKIDISPTLLTSTDTTVIYSTGTTPLLSPLLNSKKYKKSKKLQSKSISCQCQPQNKSYPRQTFSADNELLSQSRNEQLPISNPETMLNSQNDIFIVACDQYLSIGGGGSDGGGNSIWLDESLVNGSSQSSSTFLNKPFVENSNGIFISSSVEVFKFVDNYL